LEGVHGLALRGDPGLAENAVIDRAEHPRCDGRNYDGGPVLRLHHCFRPPILQTSFHSASVTGCTDSREYFTSAMSLSFGSALIAASATRLWRALGRLSC